MFLSISTSSVWSAALEIFLRIFIIFTMASWEGESHVILYKCSEKYNYINKCLYVYSDVSMVLYIGNHMTDSHVPYTRSIRTKYGVL